MKLYKFRSIEMLERLADILVGERLYCSPYHELNDPFEGVFREIIAFHFEAGRKRRLITYNDIEDYLDPSEGERAPRICSLCADSHDVRMWSHYAGGHRGVAIEIDFTDFEHFPHAVAYGDTLLDVDFDAGDVPTPHRLLTAKTRHWEYENEFRIITQDTFVSIRHRISKVIVGPRCKSSDVDTIKRLCSNSIEIVKARLDHETLKIKHP